MGSLKEGLHHGWRNGYNMAEKVEYSNAVSHVCSQRFPCPASLPTPTFLLIQTVFFFEMPFRSLRVSLPTPTSHLAHRPTARVSRDTRRPAQLHTWKNCSRGVFLKESAWLLTDMIEVNPFLCTVIKHMPSGCHWPSKISAEF